MLEQSHHFQVYLIPVEPSGYGSTSERLCHVFAPTTLCDLLGPLGSPLEGLGGEG